jgi:hypothetical protein
MLSLCKKVISLWNLSSSLGPVIYHPFWVHLAFEDSTHFQLSPHRTLLSVLYALVHRTHTTGPSTEHSELELCLTSVLMTEVYQ